MRKQMTILVIIALSAVLLGCGSSVVYQNNKQFTKNVLAVKKDQILLTELTPFEWDHLYTFPVYMRKEAIEEIIGFASDEIQETVSEMMEQLIFVKGNQVVSSMTGYASHFKFDFEFGEIGDQGLQLNSSDQPRFTVEHSKEIIRLTYTQ